MNPEQRREDEPKEQIVHYTEELKAGVAELFREWEEENKQGEPTGSANPDFDKLVGDYLVAIGENEKVVGTIGIEYCGNGIGYLKGLYVTKELRREGLATKLMASIIEYAKAQNYRKLFSATMQKNEKIHEFNEKNGFTRVENPPPTHKDFRKGTVFFEMDLGEENWTEHVEEE